ncbi:ninein isoform X2 [Hyalella azteca]|uniref:Ninein isoform X2 n=1 Tax=Hyalella azteca TaxID=294128 RepID=A0A979FUX6_HYAAZ|nr:ninein isoform X2 [Hyalella azteca]
MGDKAEFVRCIWMRLGVGDDGFLSMADLTKVCHAIGMEDDAKELFTRLDLDGDGRISFAEFLHLFQKRTPEMSITNGQTSVPAPPTSPQSISSTTSGSVWQCEGRAANVSNKSGRSVSSITSSGSGITKSGMRNSGGAVVSHSMDESPMAGALAPFLMPSEAAGSSPRTSSRSIGVWRLLQRWESCGIRDGQALLHYLGLPSSPSEELALHDLTSAIEEECTASPDESECSSRRTSEPPSSALANRRALCSLLLLETKHLRSAVESAWCERDKLRADLAHTSHRLSSQAQELDDHTMALEATAHQHIQSVEKQHQEAVRALQERLYGEREAKEQAIAALADANKRADHLQQQLNKSRDLLGQTEQACERLELENHELTTKMNAMNASLADAAALNVKLQRRQDHQEGDEHGDERGVGFLAGECPGDDAEWRELCAQLAKLRHDNQALRDSNDELQARVEQLTLHPSHRGMLSVGEMSLDGTCIGDYLLPAGPNTSISSTVIASSPRENSHPSANLSSSEQPAWSSAGIKRPAVGSSDEVSWSSPHDVSSACRRSSPDLLSPRAGKIARCASSPPPPYSSSAVLGMGAYGSSSQPASLELHLTSLSSGGSHIDEHGSVRDAFDHRRVASASSVMTSNALSSESISSASASAPQSSRRSRSGGLGSELASVRVEVAGLVQQRHHLAACVARLQIQLDAQLSQWGCWEKALKKLIKELQTGEKYAEAQKSKSLPSSSKPLAKVSSADDVFLPNVRPCLSDTSLASHEHQDAVPCTSFLPKPGLDSQTSTNRDSVSAAADGKVSASLDDVDETPNDNQASDESSYIQDSPRKAPADLLPLLTYLRSAVRDLQQKELAKRHVLEQDLSAAERQKAQLEDNLAQLQAELQSVRAELDKSEDYWLLKLQDEQDYYEEERRVYDQKFAELEAKIVQYETEELNRTSNASKQRLSPIDESLLFEQQVNELELELLEAQRLQSAAEAERNAAIELQRLAEEQLASLWQEIEKTDTKESPMNVESAEQCDQAVNNTDAMEEMCVHESNPKQNIEIFLDNTDKNTTNISCSSSSMPCSTETDVNKSLNTSNPVAEENPITASETTASKDVAVQTLALLDPTEVHMNGDQHDAAPAARSRGEQQQQQEVMQQLQESCQQLHAAQHSAAAARAQLEKLHAQLQEHMEKSLATPAAGNGAALVPASVLAAFIKGCREHQQLHVTELEAALATAHHHLQHHASQHAQQMRRAEKADKLLAGIFVENAELMRALHLTEARQKRAEQKLRSIN